MASPSWLWSDDLLSGFRMAFADRPKFAVKAGTLAVLSLFLRSKLVLFLVLICFTFLATVVGPASALLVVPTQLWVKAAGTHFYIGGTEKDLWPAILGRNHTGPDTCSVSPLPVEVATCLNASCRALLALVTVFSPIRPKFRTYIPGEVSWKVPPAMLITGNGPTPNTNYSWGDPDTWAVAPHLSVASHADLLNHYVDIAFEQATGWKTRLRDFGSNYLSVTTGGKMPFVRTVCGEKTRVSSSIWTINTPLVNETRLWRERTFHGTGPTVQWDFAALNLTDWDALIYGNTTLQSRARWMPLPNSLGSGSALMLHLDQTPITTYAYACVIVAVWNMQ
jgi:hypothetical protein